MSATLAPEHRGSTASRRPVPSSSAGTSFLARRLIAGGGRADRSVAALAAAACLVGALVVTIVLGALQATQQRATAEAWLAPQRVTMEDAGAILRAAGRYIDGQRFTVVRYAPIPGRTAPVPPGLDEAPRPGEVFASAAPRRGLRLRRGREGGSARAGGQDHHRRAGRGGSAQPGRLDYRDRRSPRLAGHDRTRIRGSVRHRSQSAAHPDRRLRGESRIASTRRRKPRTTCI